MQSLFCTKRRRFVSKKQSDYKLHIAIDFGTAGLGVAYAIKNNIYVQKWHSKVFGQIKPKCIALFDDNEQLISLGMDAKNDYMKGSPKQRQSWMLFEQFKMALYNEPDLSTLRNEVSINKTLTASNGRTMSSSAVFTAVFRYLHSNCMTWLNKNEISVNNNEIEWIVTVPGVWNDESKHCIKQWALNGGFQHIRIVYSPDCSSLSLQYLMHKTRKHVYYNVDNIHKSRLFSHMKKQYTPPSLTETAANVKVKFHKGDKYILIDAGCGGSDIACHEIYSKFGIKEILPPSGGPWGSRVINKRFNDLLSRIFSKQWMFEFKLTQKIKYMELMDNFETAKVECFKQKCKWHNIRLPVEFIWFLNEKCRRENKGNLHEYMKRNWLNERDIKKVVLENEYLKLNIKTWEKLFDRAVQPIIDHVNGLLGNKMMKQCKYVCIVGGLSVSGYFRRRFEEEFGINSDYGLQIIIPTQPMLCVVAGAAYFGITKNYIRARKLSKTYGVRVNLSLQSAYKLGIPNEHIYNNLAYNSITNICHVRNCFEIMARKGEEIPTNKVIRRKSKRLSGSQKSIIKYILCSDKKDPKIIDDNCTQKLSEIKLNFDNSIKDMVIVTEFHFYDTMLKVFVYPKSAPYLKKEVELSYVDC